MPGRHISIPIENPFDDECEFRGLVLTNGMKVILVSNSKLEMSGAALEIQIGTKHEPREVPGLAHLLEHVITGRMHNDAQISNILKEDGGEISAVTRYSSTTYYFQDLRIEPTLEIFVRTIFELVFNESLITKEHIKDINSETIIMSTSDEIRLNDIIYCKWHADGLGTEFSLGNKETLYTKVQQRDINIRDELRKFHRNYVSNIMSLCVYGRDNLNYLETLVRNNLGWRRNRRIIVQPQRTPKLHVESSCSKWFIVPTTYSKKMNIYFPLPDNYPEFESKPADHIDYLMKHRGLGLLQFYLMKQCMCTFIDCKVFNYSTQRSYFVIEIGLTSRGLQDINHVILMVFRYLELLRHRSHEQIYQQFKMINDVSKIHMIDLISKDFVDIARKINIYPLERILEKTYYRRSSLGNEINKLLGENILPHYMTVCVQAKEKEEEADSETYWTRTKYWKQQIPNEEISKWSNLENTETFGMECANSEKNDFMWNLEDLNKEEEEEAIYSFEPVKIYKTKTLKIWANTKPGESFEMYFQFTCQAAYDNPRGCNLNGMFALLLQDSINELMYPAKLVGISCQFRSNSYGMRLSINNYRYDDKFLSEVIKPVLNQLYEIHIDINKFTIFKEKYITSLKDLMSPEPYELTLYYLEVILTKQIWTYDQLINNFEDLDVTEVEQFIKNFVNNMFIQCFISGDLTHDEVRVIRTLVKHRFKNIRNPKHKIPKARDIILEKGDCFLFKGITNYHKYSSTTVYYQVGSYAKTKKPIKLFALLWILSTIIKRYCFEQLRCKEHLGYNSTSEMIQMNHTCGLMISVQGHDYETEYVENQIDNFMQQMLEKMYSMTERVFELYITQSYKSARRILPTPFYNKNPDWQQIVSQNYVFNQTTLAKNYLKTTTLNEICEFFKIMINTESQRKLSIHIKSQLLDPEEAEQIRMRDDEEEIVNIGEKETNCKIIDNIASFKIEQLARNEASRSLLERMGCITC